MSLIVFDGNTLYADRFIRIHEFGDVFRIEEGPKLWVKNKFIGLAVLGPQPHDADMEDVTFCIAATVYMLEATGIAAFYDNNNPNMRDMAFPTNSTTWFIVTRDKFYKMDKDRIQTLSDIEYADGSGETFYTVARKAGLSVHDAYVEVCQLERTVGAGIDTCDRRKLCSIKEYYEIPENKARLDKMLEKEEE